MSNAYRLHLEAASGNTEQPLTPKQFTSQSFKGAISLTKQSFKDDCDINHIIDKYQSTGILEHTRKSIPQYLDVEPVDYLSAMNTVISAQNLFKSLPASLRKDCDNDPAKFLKYVQDPKNKDNLIALGLIDKPKAEPKPQKVEVINPNPTVDLTKVEPAILPPKK